MQLFVTKCDYCDFILWTEKDDSLFVERITFDSEFFQKELELARTFFIKCIIPELLGKWFSAPKQATANTNPQQQWCYCGREHACLCLRVLCRGEVPPNLPSDEKGTETVGVSKL